MIRNLIAVLSVIVLISSCASSRKTGEILSNRSGSEIKSSIVLKEKVAPKKIDTKKVDPNRLVDFAETLTGVPYKYGSTDKNKGFDCSGFINYVFNHFKIQVPRVSKDFTNAGREVSNLDSKRGDLILFTGSDIKSGVVGHMGIVTKNNNGVITFIHAASGNNGGVMMSGLNSYFLPRYVKIIRVFDQK